MKAKAKIQNQENLFKNRLDQILNNKHPLFVLANQIDWDFFEYEFGEYYCEDNGRPALPIRLMVGIHYLKSVYDASDESGVYSILENPYWQYFLGYEYYQHSFPFDPATLVRWSQRIGSEAMEMLLRELLRTAQRMKILNPSDMHRVTVDTTVQDKAVAFPTDGKLYNKGRELLVEKAQEERIKLRQTYSRLGPRASIMQGRYGRARQYKRAQREQKNLKNYFGRVLRDVERKLPPEQYPEWEDLLSRWHRIYNQNRSDSNKLYSFHAPEVECIGKGKVHRKYEFGCKVGVVTTTRDNWVLGIQALHSNPHDGHTLAGAITQAEIMSDGVIDTVIVDRGYRGHDYEGAAEVHLTGKKKISWSLKKWLNRRNAIEPVIGHLKTDNRLDRNYNKGEESDRINAILAGCGFNFRKVFSAILFVPDFIQAKFTQIWQVIRNIDSRCSVIQMQAA
jgi:transposase, IS5 family